MTKAVVLGCGPAGLMAAHALKVAGIEDFLIYSKPRKSDMFGAQYLHAPIPGATVSAPVTVRYRLQGSADDYRRKVYGEGWTGSVSPEDLEEDHDAWDIRTTYDELWSMYHERIVGCEIDPDRVASLVMSNDVVVSSIPARALCVMPGIHTFVSQKIQAMGDAPERGQTTPYSKVAPNNTVLCNGNPEPSWYRVSRLFGYSTVEWSARVQVPLSGVAVVEKPLYTNCGCFPSVLRVGRYGRWEKGVLSHHAFNDVLGAMIP